MVVDRPGNVLVKVVVAAGRWLRWSQQALSAQKVQTYIRLPLRTELSSESMAQGCTEETQLERPQRNVKTGHESEDGVASASGSVLISRSRADIFTPSASDRDAKISYNGYARRHYCIVAGTVQRYSTHEQHSRNRAEQSLMVLLTVTAAAKAALNEYIRLQGGVEGSADLQAKLTAYTGASIGSPIKHQDLVDVSRYLMAQGSESVAKDPAVSRAWRLDIILRGAEVYRSPPPPKPEPVSSMTPI